MARTDAEVPLVWWSRSAVAVGLAIALATWLGWATGVEQLTQIRRDWPHMTPWTAALLAGLGIAILLQLGQQSRPRAWIARAVAALTGGLAAVFLAEYATGRGFGLDRMLFSDAVSALQESWPGRPSPQTAMSVLALAGAVALLRLERRWIPAAWPLSIAIAAALPLVAIAAYMLDAAQMVSVTSSTGMGNSTSIAMMLLVAATLFARSDRNPVAWVVARPDRRVLATVVTTFAVLPIWVAAWRTLFLAVGLQGDAAWVLSLALTALLLGASSFFITRNVQQLLIDKLAQSRQRAEAEHQRAEAEHQRAEADERYRILAENSIDVVVHLRGSEPVWVSPSIEPAFGWTPQKWIGADFSPRIHPDDLDTVFGALAEIAQGKTAVARFRIATADGGHRWAEGHGKPYIDVEGNTDGVIVAVRIIEAQVAVERELQQARDEAIALTESKSDYVVTVSHEIRAPLHAILGFSELLDNQLSSEGRNLAAEWSRLVRTEAERLTRLIEDLLNLSRLEAGKTKIDSTAFALRKVVDDVIQVSRFKAEAKGLKLNSSVDPNIPDWRTGDPDKLHQVLMNLVSNATKFTREGRIDVEISSGATETAADLVRFAVTDTGPGIPGEEIGRILEPFRQVSASDADRGSGLGLAISDKIVQALGGEGLGIASLEGHGTTFHFTIALPESEPNAPASIREMAETAETGSVRTILVADDNPTNQLLVEAQLKKLGYACDIASNGAEALERLETGSFEAVLMDCNMPVMDGYEATRRIRARERGTGVHLPVLALTASAMDANRDACDRAGMDGFLTKPLLLSELAKELTRFLGTSEADGLSPETDAGDSGPNGSNVHILDGAHIDRLAEELGAEPLQKVVSTFTAEMPRRLAELSRVAAEEDPDAVRRSAHALRSPSAMLGAAALADRLRVVEEAEDPVSRLSEVRLDDLIDATMEQLHARIGQAVDQGGAP
ncbi:MAG: response regulator [Actinomycetia bacterium]|nr:response regulator [Actinomycetes bacterium]